jgi:hypothetical protein
MTWIVMKMGWVDWLEWAGIPEPGRRYNRKLKLVDPLSGSPERLLVDPALNWKGFALRLARYDPVPDQCHPGWRTSHRYPELECLDRSHRLAQVVAGSARRKGQCEE